MLIEEIPMQGDKYVFKVSSELKRSTYRIFLKLKVKATISMMWLWCVSLPLTLRSRHPEVCCQKDVLIISLNSQENTCVGVSFLIK